MKKGVIGVGIAFMDIVIDTNFLQKNHSHFSSIKHQVGGSILNIVVNCGRGGMIFHKGNDDFSEIVEVYLKQNNIQPYPYFVDKPMPVFTIINQKERYTSLTESFEIHHQNDYNLSVCDEYEYGITNSPNSTFINHLLNTTTTKWIINSYIPLDTNFHLLEGCIMNKEESRMYHKDPVKVLEFLKENNVNWAIITLDKDGCIYLEDGEIKRLSPKNANLASKVRTGDLFTSVIIKSLINQENLTNAIIKAMDEVELFLSSK